MSTNTEEDHEKALVWLATLTSQVIRLKDHQRIWNEVQDIVRANPRLQIPSTFYEWMNDMYVSGIAMAIRRQTDDDSRSVSFFRLLKLVKGNPSLVSRQRYRKLFGGTSVLERLKQLGGAKSYIDGAYDNMVGEGKLQPTPDDIQADIDTLLAATDRIVLLADKVVAHHDATKPTELPTFAEVEAAISELERLTQKYNQLFRATHVSLKLNYQYDWKAIFRIPWIS